MLSGDEDLSKWLQWTGSKILAHMGTEQHFIEINVKKQSQAVRRQHMGRSIYIYQIQ